MPTDSERHAAENRAVRAACRNRALTLHRSFFGYAADLLRRAPIALRGRQWLAYLRRFRTLTLIYRTAAAVIAVLETGAFVVLSTALFLIVLPLAGALMLGILLTALLESRRTNRRLRRAFAGRTVCVLFLRETPSPFFAANALDLARRGNAVAVVSPFWISARGLKKGGFYCTVREELPRVFLVRRYYFFAMKKRVLDDTHTAFLF